MMKGLFVVASVVILLGTAGFFTRPERTTMPSSTSIVERRGCCSWHGGVCGCSLGRVSCCDGTLSPSCTC